MAGADGAKGGAACDFPALQIHFAGHEAEATLEHP
jgi:hypothetical protein